MSTNDGGQAFPNGDAVEGMTLRDWFAGQALASNCDARTFEEVAIKCYKFADAMLAARETPVTRG